MNYALTKALITRHEARRSVKYFDDKGLATIGIGHNLIASPRCPAVLAIQTAAGLPLDDQWTDASIDAQYDVDFQLNCHFLLNEDWFVALNDARQAALCDMAFNLGPERYKAFTAAKGGLFEPLVIHGQYAQACADLLRNTRLPATRYAELAGIIRSGTIPFDLPI